MPWVAGEEHDALEVIARELRWACEEVGFFSIVGHGVSTALVEETFSQVRSFHAQPSFVKEAIRMDRPAWPHGGMGYLPIGNNKLPSRDKLNMNEAFLVKCDHRLGMDDNQWPDPEALPQFRNTVERYAAAMVTLSKSLLPLFARALDMPADFFAAAFAEPFYRLRMTHYPSIADANEFGINPHVDTTFFTVLAQDKPGLAIYSERNDQWLKVPLLQDAFVVNTGELLRQWTNDRFLSTKHFATNNTGEESRYSIPFFFNANADYVMECVPSCHDDDNPPKYPPVSYAASQAVAQGE